MKALSQQNEAIQEKLDFLGFQVFPRFTLRRISKHVPKGKSEKPYNEYTSLQATKEVLELRGKNEQIPEELIDKMPEQARLTYLQNYPDNKVLKAAEETVKQNHDTKG